MPRPAGRADVVRAVRALPADRTRWVAVDGFGASGKTSLAAALAAAVPRTVVVHADDFTAPDIPEWDWPRLAAEVVSPLRAGRAARYWIERWDVGPIDEWREVAPGSLVVVEGVSVTRRELQVPWDLTVWVDAPREVRLARAEQRDGANALQRWLTDWMPSEQAWAARDRPRERAGLLVDGTLGH